VLIEPFTPSAHNDGVGGEMENGKVEKGGMVKGCMGGSGCS